MKVLLTGGSGDLGSMAGPALEKLGHEVKNLDIAQPKVGYGEFIQGSILDRKVLADVIPEVDCVVHIAALHGIHEFRGVDRHKFWDLNVTGTFNLLEASHEAHLGRFVFLSSTSVNNKESFYGHTKVLSEEACLSFTAMDPDMSIIRLRPRAFIPHWNTEVYKSFDEWAKWFWGGAVHVTDVNQSLIKSVELLSRTAVPGCPVFVIDGKYDYTASDLADWDKDGPGSTFRKHYPQYYDLAVKHGLDPSQRPSTYDIEPARSELGFAPVYSLRNLLEELAERDGGNALSVSDSASA